MTQVVAGQRFVETRVADAPAVEVGREIEYTPRHSQAALLSPELQCALDEAFAYETMPLPEPMPGPKSHLGEPGTVIPESVVYPPRPPRPVVEQTGSTTGTGDDPDEWPLLKCTCPH